jgi:dTDP-4-amino-4,6-dideoxygalactose transaminase
MGEISGLERVNHIPPIDLRRQYEPISEQVGKAVLEVLNSGRYIGGAKVAELERQFATYVGVSECVACHSGTDALYLALRALEIGEGDEVITTPFTFAAPTEAIVMAGATPVFVDIDAASFNLDVNQLEAAITSKTKAILPVYLFGQPLDMTRVMVIAQTYHLWVIEDCAQAIGAQWAGQSVGSLGHVGCFSFFPTKNLGACGDGGAVTTNDPATAATVRMLANHGQSDRYFYEATGINSRLDALQAAILLVKFPYLDFWNQQRRAVARRYQQLLQPLSGIKLPQEPAAGVGVWNQYTIQVITNSPSPASYRERVRSRLQQMGISSMIYYPLPLHLQPVYQHLGYQYGQLPVVEQVANEVLSLPMFPDLSMEEQEQVVYGLKDCLDRVGD